MRTFICQSTDEVLLQNFKVVSDRIHDMWFSIDALTFKPEAAYMRLPLSDRNGGPIQLVLECSGIQDVFVDDTEIVGSYDINYLSLNQDLFELTVICNIPIKISIRLRDIWELSLSNATDE